MRAQAAGTGRGAGVPSWAASRAGEGVRGGAGLGLQGAGGFPSLGTHETRQTLLPRAFLSAAFCQLPMPALGICNFSACMGYFENPSCIGEKRSAPNGVLQSKTQLK